MKRFSASAAPMLMQCSASGDLATAIPGWVEPVRDDMAGAKGKGTEIHSILELSAQYTARDMEYIASAMQYVADLRSTRRFKMLTEETTKATWLQQEPLTTVDVVLYTQDELHVVDYKTGKIPVYPQHNPQLMFYAACFAHLSPKAKGVTLHINQPWAGIQEGWFCSTDELKEFIEDAQLAEQNILSKQLQFVPGDNCTFCPANPHSRGDKGSPLCPAMMNLLYPTEVDEDAILKGL